jgi:hypothetical protein
LREFSGWDSPELRPGTHEVRPSGNKLGGTGGNDRSEAPTEPVALNGVACGFTDREGKPRWLVRGSGNSPNPE